MFFSPLSEPSSGKEAPEHVPGTPVPRSCPVSNLQKVQLLLSIYAGNRSLIIVEHFDL